MKKLFTLLFVACCAVAAYAQNYNLFPTPDGWLWFNNQDVVDRYVGDVNFGKSVVTVGDNAKIVQLVPADIQPDYPESEADPDMAGAGTDGKIGGPGSKVGALLLAKASGSTKPNGGGFVLALPSCATLTLNFSCESSMNFKIYATTNPNAPMTKQNANYDLNSSEGWKIISAKYSSFFRKFPFGIQEYAVEDLNNGFDDVTIKSDKPIYVWFQSLTADTIYVHGIKVTTPKKETAGIESLAASTNGVKHVYTVSGMDLGEMQSMDRLPKGLYIVREGLKSKKVVVK